MIIAPSFIISHLGKTGGDAIKDIMRALKLPEIIVVPKQSPLKHLSLVPNDRQDLILSFRRLPSRVISIYFHAKHYGPQSLRDLWIRGGTLAEDMLFRCDYMEASLNQMLCWGHVQPKYLIRSEYLREDLQKVLSHYYTLKKRHNKIILNTQTKNRNKYDHDIHQHFTDDQLRELYEKCPLWSSLEKRAYGDLLIN